MVSDEEFARIKEELEQTQKDLRIEKSISEKYKKLLLIYADGPMGTTMVKDGKIISVNESFLKMSGYEKQEIVGKDLSIVIHPEEKEMVAELNKKRQNGVSVSETYDVRAIKANGEMIHVLISARRVFLEDEYLTIAFFQDATEMADIAFRDIKLTGLYNRNGFYSFAGQLLSGIYRRRKGAWIFFIDLNKLKWINDNLGHAYGDRALIETSEILKNTFRQSDIIGRLGGDEFVVMVEAPPEIGPEKIIDRLIKEVNKNNSGKNRMFNLSLSVGVAIQSTTNTPLPLESLLRIADKAMYVAKKNTENDSIVRYCISFDEVSADEKSALLLGFNS